MITATMQSASDENWFAVNLTAGVTYEFMMSGLSADLDFSLVLSSDAEDSVALVSTTAASGSSSATMNYTADMTGTYYILTRDKLDKATGAYSLDATVVADSYTIENPGALSVGSSFTADMQSAADTDWFKITLTAGVTYKFSCSGLADYFDFSVVPASGESDTAENVLKATTGGGAAASLNFTANASGTYYVEIRDPFADAAGAYTLASAVVPNSYTLAHPGTLTIGGSTNVTMESAGDTDWFALTLTAGITYEFSESGLGAFTEFNLLSASEANVFESASNAGGVLSSSQTISESIDTTGTYYLQVEDPDGNTGAYTLNATIVPDSYTIENPGKLTVGGSITPDYESASDTDWFAITFTSGITYEITESGASGYTTFGMFSASDPEFSLSDTQETVSSSAPNSYSSITESLSETADTTGTYYIDVGDENDNGTGPYTLSAAIVPNSYPLENPGLLTVGGSVKAVMQAAGDVDYFKITLSAGVTYVFTATGVGDDALLEVEAASGATGYTTLVSSRAVSGTGSQSINYSVDTVGVYYVQISDEYENWTGNYTLSAAVATDSYTLAKPGFLTVGGIVNATIQSPSDTNWFAVTLAAGNTYDFTVNGLDNYTSFEIMPFSEADDVQADVSTNSTGAPKSETLNYSVSVSGKYYIEVRDESDDLGSSYTLTAAVVSDSYTLVNPGMLPVDGESFTGGGQTINLSNVPGNTAELASTANNWDAVSGTSGVVYLTNAQASISGGGDSVYFAGGTGNAASLYQTNGTWDGVNGSGGTVYLTSSQTTVTGGGDTVYFSSGTGNAVGLYATDDVWDAVVGSKGVIYLTGAQTTITGGGDAVYFSGGTGNAVSLYSTAGSWDGVSGSKGTIYLTSAQTTITGGSDTAVFSGGSGDAVGLYSTAGVWDAVDGAKGQIYLTSAQSTVNGGGDSIYFSGGTGNAVSLYATANVWDGVSGSSGTVYLSGAQTTITGGSDTAVFASGTGNAVGLYATGNNWDTVSGSSGLIYLTSAQASVIGGLDTIDVSGGSGNAVSLYGTNNVWDTVNGANTLVYLTSAQTSVIGGGDQVTFSGGSGNLASLAGTAGSWDYVSGSSGTVDLYTAQATVSGSSDTLNLYGASDATLLGGSDTVAFAQGIGGQDLVYDFASSDIMQLSKTDFASFTALSSHLTQSGANAVITLNSADTITLYNTTASGLTSAEFRFV